MSLSSSNTIKADETKILYYIDDQETPYLSKIPLSPGSAITLHDLKDALGRKRFDSHRFFFKSLDVDVGDVKEEISDDNAVLPCNNGKIVTWILSSSDKEVRNRFKALLMPAQSSNHCLHSDIQPCSTRQSMTFVDSLDDINCEGEINRISGVAPGFTSSIGQSESCDETYESSVLSDLRYDTRTPRPRNLKRQRARIKSKFNGPTSTCSGSTLSLNVITVTINLDTSPYLGISVVGHNSLGMPRDEYGSHGIYIGAIMKGGAIALDGRIEAGDMIMQVNDVTFQNISNDQAVCELRKAVQAQGPIRFVIAKGWNPHPSGYFSIPRQQSVHPIDTSNWVARTAAASKPRSTGSGNALRSRSPSSTASFGNSEGLSRPMFGASTSDLNLTINCDMENIANAMSVMDSGLDIRDRMWLKIRIPDAFLGSSVVDWLYSNVEGFADRRDARKYASNMLKLGYIRAAVNKAHFSEQCYYTFGDICKDFSQLTFERTLTGDPDGCETSFSNRDIPRAMRHMASNRKSSFDTMGFRNRLPQLEPDRAFARQQGDPVKLVEHGAYHFPTTPTVMSLASGCNNEDGHSDFSLVNDPFVVSGGRRQMMSSSSQAYHSTARNSPTYSFDQVHNEDSDAYGHLN